MRRVGDAKEMSGKTQYLGEGMKSRRRERLGQKKRRGGKEKRETQRDQRRKGGQESGQEDRRGAEGKKQRK